MTLGCGGAEMVNRTAIFIALTPIGADLSRQATNGGETSARLNLARPDVRTYLYGLLDKLLSTYDINFLKWITTVTGLSLGGPRLHLKTKRSYTSLTCRACMAYCRNCAQNIRKWRSNPAPVEVLV